METQREEKMKQIEAQVEYRIVGISKFGYDENKKIVFKSYNQKQEAIIDLEEYEAVFKEGRLNSTIKPYIEFAEWKPLRIIK